MERWRLAIIVAVSLLLAGVIFKTAGPRTDATGPERAVREALAPVQRTVAWVSDTFGTQVNRVRNIGRLEKENERLTAENASLLEQVRLARALQMENERLRQLLGLSQRLPARSTVARVIARSHQQWFSHVVIDKGERDGLRAGMPVVNAFGAVGQVESVTNTTARVLLLTDTKSAVGGVILEKNVPLLVEGQGEPTGTYAVARPLVANVNLDAGDVVVTSGLSALFPAGVPIGVIVAEETDPFGLRTRATVQLAVDFQYIDWVTVVLEPEGAGEADLFDLAWE